MRTQTFFALSSLLLWGVASAQSSLPTVEVRADTRESVEVSCANPASVTPKDVERVLSVEDHGATRDLRRKLISAVTDACKAGIPHIQVTRRSKGQLTWKRMD